MAREGVTVARSTVERLMRKMELRGVARGNVVRTTFSDGTAPCPLDWVNRPFRAEQPNQLSAWLEPIGYRPPAEAEANDKRQLANQATTVVA